jgi:hypothetical protein
MYLRTWPTSTLPVALSCADGKAYVAKGRQAGRAIVNDQIVARLGIALGAPVGAPALVDIAALAAVSVDLVHMKPPGVCHGTEMVRDCSERGWIAHTDEPQNTARFASLAVLYGWAHAGDHQLIYANQTPHLVYSVDHGHFFPGGPHWTIATLDADGPASVYRDIVSACNLLPADLEAPLVALAALSENDVVQAVAAPPDEWGVSMDERVALVGYLMKRRAQLLTRNP